MSLPTQTIYTHIVLVLFSIFMVLSVGTNAFAKSKIALIIGNGSYQVGPLKNPVHDAKLMGETLQGLGFKLVGGGPQLNLNREQLSTRILEFGDQLRTTKGVGVFYFAGHGVQIKGQNYLIPIGAKLEREEHLGIYAVPVDQILQQMENADNKLNLMILDACRNNPFLSNTRSLTRGIKLNAAPSGTLILYATRPGMISLDGNSDNSPFTKALTSNMQKKGLKIEEVMRSTIKQVERETNLRQTPWQEGFVREEFYFVKPDISGGKCPPGTRFEQGNCLIEQVTCPIGTTERDGQCIAQVKCPTGTQFELGKGCISEAFAQLNPRNTSAARLQQNLQLNKLNSTSQAPSLLSFVPTWSYAALTLGIVSHSINYMTPLSKPNLVNTAYGAALLGYTLAGVGLSYGLYSRLQWVPQPQSKAYSFIPVVTPTSTQASLVYLF